MINTALLCTAAAEEVTPVVLVAGHYNNAVGLFDSASAGQINRDLLQNRPLLRGGELLEFVPGMIVTQHSSDGKANQYFMRGFNLDHGTDFATWVDGMPVNMRSHAHGQGYTDLNFIIPELIDGIAYNKGPYSAEDGDFASAGSARMRLTDRLAGRHASVTVGGNGYRRGVLAADAFEHRLIAGVEVTRNDGPWDNPERLRKFNGVLRWTDGDSENGYSVTAMAYRNRWQASDQIPQRGVDGGLLGRFGTIDPTSGGEAARASLSFAGRRTDSQGRTDISAYLVRSRLNLFSNFTYALDRPLEGEFGLIHGFGFASVLADLGLPSSGLAWSLLGFNVGVELGQLAIVAAFMPLAYLFRYTWFYQRVVVGAGSVAIALLASVWLAERALDITLL